MEKMKTFDFDDWRRRYMRWMNHNKSRVMDFFRRQDRDHDGKVTREEFIQGILASSEFLFIKCTLYHCPITDLSVDYLEYFIKLYKIFQIFL